MNKIVVGNAPSPNLMKAQSRVSSLANNNYKVRSEKVAAVILNTYYSRAAAR